MVATSHDGSQSKRQPLEDPKTPGALYGAVAGPPRSHNLGMSKPLTGHPKRAWSLHETSSLLPTTTESQVREESSQPSPIRRRQNRAAKIEKAPAKGGIFYYCIYAAVNIIISVPGLCKYPSALTVCVRGFSLPLLFVFFPFLCCAICDVYRWLRCSHLQSSRLSAAHERFEQARLVLILDASTWLHAV